MHNAKIQLSADELQFAQNSNIILTKNRIISKSIELMEALAAVFQEMSKPYLSGLPAEANAPKISKGERYMDLPYVILDYPRLFKHHDIFAIRTMFWWGHHISITLHLKGAYTLLLPSANTLQTGWYLQVAGDEWQHHYDHTTHRLLNSMRRDQFKTICDTLPFVKIAYFLPVEDWNEATTLLPEKFRTLITVLQ